jgi:hypothetical protein
VTPVSSLPYHAAFALDDDAANRLLAALLVAGVFDREFTTVGPTPLIAGDLAPVFPGAGLELFPPASPAAVRLQARVAPVAVFDGPALSRLRMAGLALSISLDLGGGQSRTVLHWDLDVTLPLSWSVAPATSQLAVAAGSPLVTAAVLGNLAGHAPVQAAASLGPLLSSWLGVLLEPLALIPVPMQPMPGASLVEVSPLPASPTVSVAWLSNL